MKLYRREKYLKRIRPFYHDTDLIKVITGIRRCGKSSLMQTIAEELMESGINENNIKFLNLDKYGYRSITDSDSLEKLLFGPWNANGTKYIFIDEIQNVKDFEPVINELREEDEYSIFITGSNSYLLSGELATKLTGRYLQFEISTLDFKEYKEMKNFYSLKVDSDIDKEFDNYILEGGFPRAVRFQTFDEKRKYTQDVLENIFEKDIKKRLKIKNREAFGIVQKYIINNFCSPTSISNIQSDLQKNGLRITRETLHKYIQALIDAKIISECKRFDLKSRKSIGGESKYYLTDLSLYYAFNTDNRISYGQSLENLVYQYLKTTNHEVSVGKIGNFECDFIARSENSDYAYIQVAYTLHEKDKESTEKLKEREYRPFRSIKDGYPRYIISLDRFRDQQEGVHHISAFELFDGDKI